MYLILLQALAGGLLFIRNRRTGLQIVLLYIPVLLLFAPWVGQLFYQSVMARDLSTVMAILVIGAVITLLANLLADVTYSYVDPRIRFGKR